MYKRKYLIILVALVMLLLLSAFQAPQMGWPEIFEWVIGIALLLMGAPLTQFLKNLLSVKDKVAFLLTGLVATVIAILQLFLTDVLSWESFTLVNFPIAFSAVLSVATIYYNLLKGTDSVLGARGLLAGSDKTE